MEKMFEEMIDSVGHRMDNKEGSQMQRLLNKSTIRVAIVEDKAYWVNDHKFYMADIDETGRIDGENAEQIDVFSLPAKKVEKLLEILDSISD
ncbi:MAG: hypothetical protein ACO295_05140 [Sediminibacterium sp.]